MRGDANQPVLIEADITRTCAHVCSFDHLVGAGEQCCRHTDTKGFGGLKVDDEVEFRRLQHRKIRRPLTLQDTRSIHADLPIGVSDTRPIADQSTFDGIFSKLIDGRQPMLCRKCNDAAAARVEIRVGGDQQGTNTRA